jgi:hypothetical protein
LWLHYQRHNEHSSYAPRQQVDDDPDTNEMSCDELIRG